MSAAGSERGSDAESVEGEAEKPMEPDVLAEVLRRIRLRQLPAADVAMRLVRQLHDLLRDECSTLVRIPAPPEGGRIIVVGDIHGYFNDLLRLADDHGAPSQKNQYLFNGDFADRGDWGPEVVMFVFTLKLLHPQAVHLNRGNHESKLMTDSWGFREQITRTYARPPGAGDRLYSLIHETYRQLPLCHLIADQIFVVHGGLPRRPVTLQEIESVPRGPTPKKLSTKADEIFEALLWSDPADHQGESERGAGCLFDDAMTAKFLSDNGLLCMIRSHECVRNGYRSDHHGKCKTVFSASNYDKILAGNDAAVVYIFSDLRVHACVPWNESYVKREWRRRRVFGDGPRDNWDTDKFHSDLAVRTLQRVADQNGEQGPAVLTVARSRALGEVYRLVFLSRPQLLEAFEHADEEHSGRLSPERWAEVMSTCLRTGRRFPWAELQPHLALTGPDGRISYMEFLIRFHNPLSRWIADRWAQSTLHSLQRQLGERAPEEFHRLDTGQNGHLTYAELRPLIHRHLPTTAREARSQAAHVFAVFRTIDRDRNGFVTLDEFVAALREARADTLFTPPDKPATGLAAWCPCLGGRKKRVPPLTSLQVQWDSIEHAIRVLCRSHVEVCRIGRMADVTGDGLVSKEAFVATLSRLLRADRGRTATAISEDLWELLKKYQLEVQQKQPRADGNILVTDLEPLLEVTDGGLGSTPQASPPLAPGQDGDCTAQSTSPIVP
eukprot:TRINITY_DN24833_c0_g1_i1.p1 TRINITY_DN24833_c0_g1~~TRINITY_DN24833_c0_g1_i1.p1  ORF type:complete len:837 (+),score=241.43 TRINITY_DN24833_c0_g1_i1:344-2512(+)